ncbi:histidine kinase [Campylobacter concisus]|uniref:TetR/AcrR family transcriptional regulator n=1 Tax=Campylobacter concisus TaxID=199 RepID=UPI0018AB4034|nr:TetR/AcrR family transcriptional regulator [Campylobacter concisus]QPI02880.1 histidine kinase [Campylobacter concisus]
MNKRKVAEFIGKDIKTIYNWEKTNPNLYKILEFYFQKESEINPTHKELIELFDKLSKIEQQFYLSDIRARILKKEIG